jgi:hypothetical protein
MDVVEDGVDGKSSEGHDTRAKSSPVHAKFFFSLVISAISKYLIEKSINH